MSTHFTMWCGMCEVSGPDIRRSAGGVGFLIKPPTGGFADGANATAEFLIDHADCAALFLVKENSSVRTVLSHLGAEHGECWAAKADGVELGLDE